MMAEEMVNFRCWMCVTNSSSSDRLHPFVPWLTRLTPCLPCRRRRRPRRHRRLSVRPSVQSTLSHSLSLSLSLLYSGNSAAADVDYVFLVSPSDEHVHGSVHISKYEASIVADEARARALASYTLPAGAPRGQVLCFGARRALRQGVHNKTLAS